MKSSKTPAFISIPAVVFLLAAVALMFLRKAPSTHLPAPTPPKVIGAHPRIYPSTDSLAALPDSLNPFIQSVDLDEVTERVKAVQQCGSCHQQEYQNWADGPHAYSYRSMRKLYDTASDSVLGYFPKAYGKWIHANMQVCFQCHATENLYESNFAGIEQATHPSQINDSAFPELHTMGHPRTDPRTYTTGIDCYTCHYNGERVITGPNFKPDPKKAAMPGYCNPLPTPFFTTNENCGTCHTFAVETMQANLDRGMHFEQTNCIQCHQEYDAHGRGTHFEDWRFADRQRHPSKFAKGGLFESLMVKVQKGPESKLVVDWANTVSPHGLTECGEVVLTIQVHDQGGRLALQQDIRLNRKAQHDEHLRKQLFGEEPPGVVGHPFDPSDPPIHAEFALKGRNIQSGKIRLTAIDKAQYWGADAIGVPVYEKEIVF